jgi:hypothetical protein
MRAKDEIPSGTTRSCRPAGWAASLLAVALGRATVPVRGEIPAPVGAWRSADGTVRLEIRTDGTYAGRVAGRRRPAHGRYNLDGSRITLLDDSGLHTPVTLHDGVLEMAGHRLGRA